MSLLKLKKKKKNTKNSEFQFFSGYVKMKCTQKSYDFTKMSTFNFWKSYYLNDKIEYFDYCV